MRLTICGPNGLDPPFHVHAFMCMDLANRRRYPNAAEMWSDHFASEEEVILSVYDFYPAENGCTNDEAVEQLHQEFKFFPCVKWAKVVT